MTDSWLQQEILEQPGVLRQFMAAERANIDHIAQVIRDYDPRFVLLVARGSSDNAARYGQYLFGSMNRLVVALATPSLYTAYNQPPNMDGALVLAISQSGQSPDIVAVINEGRQQGALTVAITNDPDSPLAQAAEYTIGLHTGQERSVAATKTYTTSLMAIAMLSATVAQNTTCLAALETVPDTIESVTGQAQTIIQASATYRDITACVVISRGYNYATAYEIALKLKELAYILAEPYSTADFQHGPVALVGRGFPVLAIVPDGKMADELTVFLGDLKGHGADLIVVSARESALALARTPLPLPDDVPEWLSPLVTVVVGQLFALGLTLAKGYDVDQPRHIRKITRTK